MSHDSRLRIGLASVRNVPGVDERLAVTGQMIRHAADRGVAIVCFPETWLPGLRGMDFDVPPHDQARQAASLESVREMAAQADVAVILPMEWDTPEGTLNLAWVISRKGDVEGFQSKNQIPPSEEAYYVPGHTRQVFAIDGVTFGITICHEGWRYPEATRWAARRGAQVVFHPHLTGSDTSGPILTRWGDPQSPYYEKTMIARAVENSIYFASVNCAMRYQESATTLIDPEGNLHSHVPYGVEDVLIADLELETATRVYATRFCPERFPGHTQASKGPA